MNKRYLSSRVFPLVCLGLISAVLVSGCSKGSGNQIQPEAQAKTQSSTKQVQASGELYSKETAVINPPKLKNMWQYKVTFLLPEGAQVKKGQPVVGFETSQLKQKLAIKKSELQSALKNLENTKRKNTEKEQKLKLDVAEKQMDMEKAQRKTNMENLSVSQLKLKTLQLEFEIARDQYEKAKSELKFHQEQSGVDVNIAQSNIDRLQTEIKELENSIQRGTVKAPKSGVVVYKPDYQGKKVSVGDTIWMGREVVELPSLETIAVKAEIPEVETQKIKKNQFARVELDAFPERSFKGKVVSLGRVYKRRSQEQPEIVFEIKIDLDKPDAEIMRPGMKARITILN